MRTRMIAALIGVALLAGGCGSGSTGVPAEILTPAGAAGRTGRVVVEGFLWSVGGVAGTDVRVCEAILESYPPQCGEPSIPVDDFGLEQVGGLQREGTVAWAERVRLAGAIVDGVLEVERVELNTYDPSGGLALRALVPVRVAPGEVAWTLVLTNAGPDPVALTYPTGQDADVVLMDAGGAVVYRWSNERSFTQTMREATLQPGSGRRIVLEGRLDVRSGDYTLVATLAAEPAPGQASGRITVG